MNGGCFEFFVRRATQLGFEEAVGYRPILKRSETEGRKLFDLLTRQLLRYQARHYTFADSYARPPTNPAANPSTSFRSRQISK
jgi:hypothetical protein